MEAAAWVQAISTVVLVIVTVVYAVRTHQMLEEMREQTRIQKTPNLISKLMRTYLKEFEGHNKIQNDDETKLFCWLRFQNLSLYSLYIVEARLRGEMLKSSIKVRPQVFLAPGETHDFWLPHQEALDKKISPYHDSAIDRVLAYLYLEVDVVYAPIGERKQRFTYEIEILGNQYIICHRVDLADLAY
jgi:hypothetical protein